MKIHQTIMAIKGGTINESDSKMGSDAQDPESEHIHVAVQESKEERARQVAFLAKNAASPPPAIPLPASTLTIKPSLCFPEQEKKGHQR